MHVLDRARDWLEVLLHAAKLSHRAISDVADWGATDPADDTNKGTSQPVSPQTYVTLKATSVRVWLPLRSIARTSVL